MSKLVTFFTCSFLFFAGISNEAAAQEKKRGFLRDLLKIDTPKEIKYVEPDTAKHVVLAENKHSAEAKKDDIVIKKAGTAINSDAAILRKELSIVSEDTTAVEMSEESLVEVSESLKIDRDWVTLHEYYSIWDSRNINPYEFDGTKFRDTLNLVLFDESVGESWAPPLRETQVTSDFGFRRHRWHYGTDIRLNVGDTVQAVFDGIVRIAKYDPQGYGYYILLRHKNGLETLYGHLSEQLVQVGDEVKAGEVIGLGGNTGRSSGPHLHFEFRYKGSPIDPSDLYDFDANSFLSESYELSPASFSYLKEAKKVYYHTVRRGDTLSGISRKYGKSVSQLCKMNGLSTRSTLRVGQRLRVH